MKRLFPRVLLLFLPCCMAISLPLAAQPIYEPTPENMEVRKEFEADRFGIFLHWGIYSEYAQGEWYLEFGKLRNSEYSKAADCFYPVRFDARRWVRSFKEAGARYICITARHHDGFSMFKTSASPYNIVDATPFRRDVLAELAAACKEEGLKLHFYYSLLDWVREDYPIGKSGRHTGRVGNKADYNAYFDFMKSQIRELLTNYGDVRALWFDGYWDHAGEQPAFDWRMPELYRYIHSLRPACLIGNNHHISPISGEDFQMFERDLPGENKAGFSGQAVSHLPLEMCQTMNGMWGYKVADLNYKSVKDMVRLLVRAAAKGSNLLLNIGPRPNGELPDLSIDRLKGIGQWMKLYGETIYGTQAGCVGAQEWGVSTQKGMQLFLHVMSSEPRQVLVPLKQKVKGVVEFLSGRKLPYKQQKDGSLLITLPERGDEIDYVITVTLKK
ncbi:MAG TPA: alpha-L-fucosidase [Prevotellaceae bacterium]|nr:alpha-L-fucosidase [Prevotellaceae bacterium]